MLRDKNLIPLSHQHQHALALCVRIDRAVQAGNPDVPAFQAEIRQIVDSEIRIHFDAEEKIVFPAAEMFPELKGLIAELLAEHAVLRELFEMAGFGQFDSDLLKKFAGTLAAHIRKEERQLFERMQRLLTVEQLSSLGSVLHKALSEVEKACLLPGEATKLRGKA